MQSFLRKLILQHVCSTRHAWFWPGAWNRRLESSFAARWPNFVGIKSWVSSFTCRRGCHIWGHQHFDHWRRDCLNGRSRLRLQRCCLKALLSCRTSFESTKNWKRSQLNFSLTYDDQIVSDRIRSLPVRIDSKKCVEGWNMMELNPSWSWKHHILPMHWTQQHRHWLTYLSWARKNVQAHMKQPIATSERRQFASVRGIRQIYTYMCIYVWGSGLVKQDSQEISKYLHNMEPPSYKLVYKPHQL